MNVSSVLSELADQYPGKPVIQLPPDSPSEIVCAFDPTNDHPEWSRAVAVIDRSAPHFHNKTVEVYHVIKGTLTLYVGNDEFTLYEGQEFTVIPGRVHWAVGDQTWVEVYCTPGYDPADHILVDAQ